VKRSRLTIVGLSSAMLVAYAGCTESGDRRAQGARATSPVVDSPLDASLQRVLEQGRDAGGSPGAQASLVWADGRTWSGSSGLAVVDDGTPVTDATLFAMGSTTKAYTAVLVLDLVEDGALSLDDSLAQWVPELTGAGRITLRQLLLHTSGLAQIAGSDIPAALEADPDGHLTADEVMLEPACSPGDCYHYQSPDYGLLGEVVERETGNPFAGELRDRVLDPLGLDDSFFPSQEESAGPVATGYGFGPPTAADEVAALRVEGVENPYPGAGGGLLATSTDVARFMHALFSDRILGRDSIAEMVDFTVTEDVPGVDECNAVGLGVVRGSLREEETWGFGGFTGNFHSTATFLPRYGLTIVVAVNDDGDTGAIAQSLADVALPATDVERPGFAGGSCNYDIYVGRPDGAGQRRLTTHPATDGGMVAWAPGGREIAFVSDRRGNADVFVMTPDGEHQTALTKDPAEDAGAAWSPDGSRIAFWSDRGGDDDIYSMQRDGGRLVRLTSSPRDDVLPAWSPDGRMIAFVSGRPGEPHDLWVMNADGSNPRRLTRTKTDEWWPAWSPDGTRIAYVSDHRLIGGGGIEILDLVDGDAVTLDVAVEGPRSPAWSADGRIAVVDFAGDIWTVEPDGTRLGRVTDTAAKEFGPAWSPDGRLLAFPSQRWQTGFRRTD
jgi:CubicO group peptidase (beta-lactamase class C family)/Tol biopolymer transport system component